MKMLAARGKSQYRPGLLAIILGDPDPEDRIGRQQTRSWHTVRCRAHAPLHRVENARWCSASRPRATTPRAPSSTARGRVLASVVSSQLEAHREWGGVVPEIASREHLRNWPAVSDEALERAGIGLDDVDVVAATRGPGLVGSLLVGLSIGRAIAWARGIPFHGVHHLEAHLHSPWLRERDEAASAPPDRFVGLVVSGGHSLLVEAEEGGRRLHTVAETRDDAMGEVFDKVGKRVGLPFPGGPLLDALAERGDAAAHPLPVGSCGDSLDFSFSGLKSRALLDLDRMAKAESRSRGERRARAPRPTAPICLSRCSISSPGFAPPPCGRSSIASPGSTRRVRSRSWRCPAASPPTDCCAASSRRGPSASRSICGWWRCASAATTRR